MKIKKGSPEAHTSKSKVPFGDNYGTGIRQKIGRMRGDTVGYRPASKKQMGTPPRSLA